MHVTGNSPVDSSAIQLAERRQKMLEITEKVLPRLSTLEAELKNVETRLAANTFYFEGGAAKIYIPDNPYQEHPLTALEQELAWQKELLDKTPELRDELKPLYDRINTAKACCNRAQEEMHARRENVASRILSVASRCFRWIESFGWSSANSK